MTFVTILKMILHSVMGEYLPGNIVLSSLGIRVRKLPLKDRKMLMLVLGYSMIDNIPLCKRSQHCLKKVIVKPYGPKALKSSI